MIAPRVISLDLDDTLWPIGQVIAAAENELLRWLRENHPRAVQGHDANSMRAARALVATRFPEQSHDMTFLRRRALSEQFVAAGYDQAEPAAALQALEVFLAARNRVVVYEDVLPALRRLRRKYRLFALSNGNADLKLCGVDAWFDGHVTAAAAGAAKPDARIFACLRQAAGVEPIEIMHIGDDPLADVVGATRAGMQAVWLNRETRAWPEQYAKPLRTVTTLADIE